ncbi:MAG: PhzF family phenazine biosynthesis isomerase [Lachnospiraceae bacterium]|nr:PhzF family phenazine biosynthesis isomerase [Lachnospiraceae bacterium]
MHQMIHTVVFEEKPGGGNPCPVTVDADALSTEEMQAMTFGFGEESAFLMKPSRDDCDVKARYFVPLHEMEMCTHATIGSVTVLVETGRVTESPVRLETALGPVSVDWEREGGRVKVSLSQFLPRFAEENPAPEEVCRALRITPDELADLPIESAATSRFKLLVPLKEKATVYRLEPDFEYLWSLCDKYHTTGFYPFAPEPGDDPRLFCARQFPCRAGYPEDPATGVAASALSAYMVEHRLLPLTDGWNEITVRQGEAMGKPSIISAACFLEDGRVTATRVSGKARLD